MRRVLSAALLVLALPGLRARAQEAPEEKGPPRWYAGRLELPYRFDRLRDSQAVLADPATGEVFVCDTRGNRIAIFDRDGLFLYEIRGGQVFRAPVDLAVDPEGYIVLLANRSGGKGLLLLDFDGLHLENIELSGLPEGADAPDLVSVALSEEGSTLFALDQANQQLWIADRGGRVRGAAAMAADLDEKEASEQALGKVDVYGETVLVGVPTAGEVRLFGLEGSPRGWLGRKGTARCESAFPVAGALRPDGVAMVLDKQRALFMEWQPGTNRCLDEHSGFGNAPGAFYQPADLGFDRESGRIYVSQGFEGRVQVFQLPAAAAPAAEAVVAEVPEQVEVAQPEREAPAAPAPREAPLPAELPAPREAPLPSAVPAPAPEPTPAAEERSDRAAVTATVLAWAQAWSDRRVEDYLSYYAADFRPPRGLERSAWAALRRSRLTRPSFIEVKISDVDVELVTPDRARATFAQSYRSNLYRDEVVKRLELERRDGSWRILEEIVLEGPGY